MAVTEFSSIDPSTGSEIGRWPVADAAQRRALLEAGARAARDARSTSFEERSALLRAIGAELTRRREDLAATATREMGKPTKEALAEVDKCAAGCAYFAEHGPAMLADEPLDGNGAEAYSSYLPLGLIFAIMPWNYPYWQVFRHLAPAIMAGNAVLVKHAENTLGVAHAIVDAARAAGAPEGLIGTVVCTVEEAKEVIESAEVAAVTLTGSTGAGSKVAAIAGAVWKKTVLELGGSDAFVVLEDADVERAAKVAVTARFQNCGQSCIAAKRFVVVDAVADAFTEAFVAGVRGLVVGDPRAEGTTIGPMARGDLRAGLARQLEGATAGGAKVLVDGGVRAGDGFFFEPVVLAVEDTGSPVWAQETFGPVAPILRVPDEAAALAAMNDSDYGLGGNVWTADLDRGRAFARKVDSGAVFVNGMTASDPRLPFGGVKRSGYGRELSTVGAREFTNVQTVWVAPANG
jgi:succinate-semialdehyde dehydrogenase/glutarate-semialdehyde dehydrogenase